MNNEDLGDEMESGLPNWCCGRISPWARLSIEDRKTPSASTLAEGKWVDDENESFWKEPEWTLRDEVAENYKEIP